MLLALGALGVVYGDIGTLPLYAINLHTMHQQSTRSMASRTPDILQ